MIWSDPLTIALLFQDKKKKRKGAMVGEAMQGWTDTQHLLPMIAYSLRRQHQP